MPLTVWIRFSVGTTEREDRVQVRFVELLPGRRIVEAATFETDDPALKGEMTIAVTFEPTAGGTRVTFEATNLPPGVRAEDHKTGTKTSRSGSWHGCSHNPHPEEARSAVSITAE
jgi:uncharacterized protein YndB with AHSA1/START domain